MVDAAKSASIMQLLQANGKGPWMCMEVGDRQGVELGSSHGAWYSASMGARRVAMGLFLWWKCNLDGDIRGQGVGALGQGKAWQCNPDGYIRGQGVGALGRLGKASFFVEM